MDIGKLKQKAKKILTDKNWDKLLIEAHLASKDFVVRSQREDFENLGLTNISFTKKPIEVGIYNYVTEFLIGEIKGIKFELGVYTHRAISFDDEPYITAIISLIINNNKSLGVIYETQEEAFRAYQYTLISVEEFHNNDLIDPLLMAFQEAINVRERRRNEKEEKRYTGKFTF